MPNQRASHSLNLVVELAGIPGAGKTALARRVADVLNQEGITAFIPEIRPIPADNRLRPRGRKLFKYMICLIANPRFVLTSIKMIMLSRQRVTLKIPWILRMWLTRSCRMKEYHRLNGVHLIDAGIFQGLWSIWFDSLEKSSGNFKGSDHFLLTTPHVIVFVGCSWAVIAQRLKQRVSKQSRLAKAIEHDSQALTKAESVLETVTLFAHQVALQNGNLQIVSVLNEQESDFEVAVTKITTVIKEQLLSHSPIGNEVKHSVS